MFRRRMRITSNMLKDKSSKKAWPWAASQTPDHDICTEKLLINKTGHLLSGCMVCNRQRLMAIIRNRSSRKRNERAWLSTASSIPKIWVPWVVSNALEKSSQKSDEIFSYLKRTSSFPVGRITYLFILFWYSALWNARNVMRNRCLSYTRERNSILRRSNTLRKPKEIRTSFGDMSLQLGDFSSAHFLFSYCTGNAYVRAR